MKHTLALDFGTTNSLISRWDNTSQSVEIINLPQVSANGSENQPPLIPSLLYVQNGQTGNIVVGQAVNDQHLNQQKDNRLFRNFKRSIAASPALKPRTIDGTLWSNRDAGHRFIHHLFSLLPYRPDDIEQLVLTAPITSFTGYLNWLNEVTEGFSAADKIRIIDESTAAALGYAVTKPGAVVLVFDLGGGTLDLSLVRLPENREKTGGFLKRLLHLDSRQHTAQVIAKAGQVIGGSDIDQWLLADVLQRMGLSVKDLHDDYAPFLTTCEQAKILLSTTESVPLSFEIAGQPHTVTVTRSELDDLLADNGFFETLHHVVDKVMHTARQHGIFKEDIDSVLMVGGVSLMPAVQKWLKKYFNDMVVRTDKPFTAVVEGALQIATGGGVKDILTHSYGLRYLDSTTGLHHYDEIIPMGTPYPTGKPIEVILTASQPNQTEVELVLGQIDTLIGGHLEMAYEGGQAVFVAQPIHSELEIVAFNAGIVPLNPPGQPGEERLRATFWIDAQHRLVATVMDLKTGQLILNTTAGVDPAAGSTPTSPTTHGREPALPACQQKRGWHLTGKGLATMFDVLPPEAIALNAVIAALQHPDITVRYSAAAFLRRRGDREARLIMQNMLEHTEARVRASVARQLHGFSWFAVEPLIQKALQDPDLRVREAAIYALCDRDEVQAYQLMATTLQDENDFVRAAATFGLRECTNPQAVPVLAAAILADDAEVRVKALDALSVNGTRQAVPVVHQALFDPVPYVQYTATMSLLALQRADCLAELAGYIKQIYGESREHILRGFFQASNHLGIDIVSSPSAEKIFDALEVALQDHYAPVRKAVVWPLAWLDHKRARSLLRQAYNQEQDDQVKAHIIYVAVNILSPLGKEFLEDGRQNKSNIVRKMAQEIEADIESGAIRVE